VRSGGSLDGACRTFIADGAERVTAGREALAEPEIVRPSPSCANERRTFSAGDAERATACREQRT